MRGDHFNQAAAGSTRRADRLGRSIAIAVGANFLAAGLWAVLAPASFFETAATADLPFFGGLAVLLVAAAIVRAVNSRR